MFCACTAQFVSDLFGNPEDRFSHDAVHFMTRTYYIPDIIGKPVHDGVESADKL